MFLKDLLLDLCFGFLTPVIYGTANSRIDEANSYTSIIHLDKITKSLGPRKRSHVLKSGIEFYGMFIAYAFIKHTIPSDKIPKSTNRRYAGRYEKEAGAL